MNLTQEQVKGIIGWLESHWGPDKKCPYCDNTKWLVSDKLFELSQLRGQFPTEIVRMPVATVTCTNCGNTVLVNTVITKIDGLEGGQK